MKGMFIPEITVEMFRNACLESIETLMAEGEVYDIDYDPEQRWIPCSERLPEYEEYVLVTFIDKSAINTKVMCVRRIEGFVDWYWSDFADEYTWEASEVVAWMPLPNPWKEGQDETN